LDPDALIAFTKKNTPGIQATSDAMAAGCKKGDAQLDFSALFKAYQPQ